MRIKFFNAYQDFIIARVLQLTHKPKRHITQYNNNNNTTYEWMGGWVKWMGSVDGFRWMGGLVMLVWLGLVDWSCWYGQDWWIGRVGMVRIGWIGF